MKIKKTIALLLAIILIAGSTTKTYAWGAQGHRLVVETAVSLLTPQVRQKVLAALGSNYTSDLAAVWMDSVRINHVCKNKYTSDWHFLNMEANQTYAQVANKNDVVYNLQRVIGSFDHIQTLSKDSLKQNLRILFHLMGDITQPLHDGYGSDWGANYDTVTTPKFNVKDNNLHHVWDDTIIQEGKLSAATCLTYYHSMTPAKLAQIKQGTTTAWMLQARTYLPNVYACHPVRPGTTALTLNYLDINVPVVQQQLVFAAVRLAAVLQKAFGN